MIRSSFTCANETEEVWLPSSTSPGLVPGLAPSDPIQIQRSVCKHASGKTYDKSLKYPTLVKIYMNQLTVVLLKRMPTCCSMT